MLKRKIIHWPILLTVSGLVLIAARLFAGSFGNVFWVTVAVITIAILVNGIVAIFEDEQPGGFNNPNKKMGTLENEEGDEDT